MSMVVYTRVNCAECNKVKHLLDSLNIPYDSYDATSPDSTGFNFLVEKGLRSVPQVWVNERYLGGYAGVFQYLLEEDII